MPARKELSPNFRTRLSPGDGEAILRATGWLSLTPIEFQDAILAQCRWQWFGPGEAIVTAGDPDAPLIGIAAGAASVVTAVGPTDTPLTHVIYPGWWVGTVPLVSGLPTQNNTVARIPVYSAVVQQRIVRQLLELNPYWWRFIANVLLQYAEAAAIIAADLLIRESNRRCAASLLRIADCRLEGSRPTIAPVSQTELASVANLSRNTASSLLRDFEQNGLIARNYREIAILHPETLRAIANDTYAVTL